MDTEPSLSSLDKYTENVIFSTILRYALFLGAIFQLICVGAAVFLPSDIEELPDLEDFADDEKEEPKRGENSGKDIPRRLHKLRKQDKKKRR